MFPHSALDRGPLTLKGCTSKHPLGGIGAVQAPCTARGRAASAVRSVQDSVPTTRAHSPLHIEVENEVQRGQAPTAPQHRAAFDTRQRTKRAGRKSGRGSGWINGFGPTTAAMSRCPARASPTTRCDRTSGKEERLSTAEVAPDTPRPLAADSSPINTLCFTGTSRRY